VRGTVGIGILAAVAGLVGYWLFAPDAADGDRAGEPQRTRITAREPAQAEEPPQPPPLLGSELPLDRDGFAFRRLERPLPPDVARLWADAGAGLLADVDSRAILWSRKPDEVLPIASVSKVLTTLEALAQVRERPEVSLQMPIPVSRAAMRTGGSQLWLEAGARYPLGQLLASLLVQSANDAAVAVAEALGGRHGEPGFVVRMNRRARSLGMRTARFYNPHGLPGDSPDADNRASCLDLLTLALACADYPQLRRWAAVRQRAFTHTNGTVVQMRNHNRLLFDDRSITGLKTGFTRRAGFCLLLTARDGGRQLVAVGLGFARRQQRDKAMRALLAWGRQPETAAK